MTTSSDFAAWESWSKSQIEEHGNSPDGWIRTSKNLIESGGLVIEAYSAALPIMLRNVLNGGPVADGRTPEEEEIVRRGLQTHSVGLMLFGFAIECLLKALFLQRGGILYVNGKYRLRLLKSHNLAELTYAVGCEDLFSEPQLDVLDLLSARNEMGRYPVHAKHTDYGLRPWVVHDDGCTRFYGIWDAQKSVRVFEILRIMFRALGEEVPASADALVEDMRIQCAAYRTPLPPEVEHLRDVDR